MEKNYRQTLFKQLSKNWSTYYDDVFVGEFFRFLEKKGSVKDGDLTIKVSFSNYRQFAAKEVGVYDDRYVAAGYLKFLSCIIESYLESFDDKDYEKLEEGLEAPYFKITLSMLPSAKLKIIDNLLYKATENSVGFGFFVEPNFLGTGIMQDISDRVFYDYDFDKYFSVDLSKYDRIFLDFPLASPIDRALITLAFLEYHMGQNLVLGYFPTDIKTKNGGKYLTRRILHGDHTIYPDFAVYVGNVYSLLAFFPPTRYGYRFEFPNHFLEVASNMFYPAPDGRTLYSGFKNFDTLLDILKRSSSNISLDNITQIYNYSKKVKYHRVFYPVFLNHLHTAKEFFSSYERILPDFFKMFDVNEYVVKFPLEKADDYYDYLEKSYEMCVKKLEPSSSNTPGISI